MILKMKKIILSLALVLTCLLVSCNKPAPVVDSVTLISPETVTVPVGGEDVSITFASSVAWKIFSSEAWLFVKPGAGEAGETVTVKATVLPNDSNDPREATITISAGTASTKVKVSQAQIDGLVVNATDFTVEAAGGNVEIPVSANVDYQVLIPDGVDWIHVTKTRGMTDYTVVLAVDGTQSYIVDYDGVGETDDIIRSAQVTVSYGSILQQVTVKQKAFQPYFEYEGDWAILQWSHDEPVEIPREGAEITIGIRANIDWRAYLSVDSADGDGTGETEDLGWAKLTVDKTQIRLKVEPNDTPFPREAQIRSIGFINGAEDRNFMGWGWISQPGKAAEGVGHELAWSRWLSGLDIATGYNRLAYAADGILLVSAGSRTTGVGASDGSFVKNFDYPGMGTYSLCSDDAGHVIIVPDVTADSDEGTGALVSGTELTIHYSQDPENMGKTIKVANRLPGNLGGIRVRGNLAEKAVITGVAGSSGDWFGYEIQDYKVVSGASGTQYWGPVAGPYVFDSPWEAAAISVGTSLQDGILYRGNDGKRCLFYLADAYTPASGAPSKWSLMSSVGCGSDENPDNLAIADYKGRKIVAFTQGAWADYSGVAPIYVMEMTEDHRLYSLLTIYPTDDIEGLDQKYTTFNSADILLHPTDEGLDLYYVNSGRDILAKYKVTL